MGFYLIQEAYCRSQVWAKGLLCQVHCTEVHQQWMLFGSCLSVPIEAHPLSFSLLDNSTVLQNIVT